MSAGNKLVNLDDLKIAYDALIEAIAESGHTMSADLTIQKNTPAIFYYNSGGSAWAAMVYEVVDSGGNNRLALAVRKDGSVGQEIYFLPTPDAHAAQTNYGILTTKSPVTIGQGGTGADNAIAALNNLGGAKYINLTGASETVSSIYNALKDMSVGETANISLGGSAMELLTGSGGSATAKVTGYGVGHVYRNGSGDFRFFVTAPYGNYQYAFRADVAATAITTQNVYRYAGTQI